MTDLPRRPLVGTVAVQERSHPWGAETVMVPLREQVTPPTEVVSVQVNVPAEA